jgi:hypothetical protein
VGEAQEQLEMKKRSEIVEKVTARKSVPVAAIMTLSTAASGTTTALPWKDKPKKIDQVCHGVNIERKGGCCCYSYIK